MIMTVINDGDRMYQWWQWWQSLQWWQWQHDNNDDDDQRWRPQLYPWIVCPWWGKGSTRYTIFLLMTISLFFKAIIITSSGSRIIFLHHRHPLSMIKYVTSCLNGMANIISRPQSARLKVLAVSAGWCYHHHHCHHRCHDIIVIIVIIIFVVIIENPTTLIIIITNVCRDFPQSQDTVSFWESLWWEFQSPHSNFTKRTYIWLFLVQCKGSKERY